MRTGTRPRGAYTLMELIVVLTIIAILASFTISAVFRLQEGQREKNTNTTIHKIHMELEKQWAAKVALIKAETLPQAVIEVTKDQYGVPDLARARALHMKLRLRQEFPQSFGEVYSRVTLGPINGQTYIYDGKPAFKTALKSPRKLSPTTYEDPYQEGQSAVMLVLILSQGAGGSTTNVESIAPNTTLTFRQDNNLPDMQLKVLVDEWGTQIGFRRAYDDDMFDVAAELNQPPFVSSTQVASGKMDPQDPQGRLQLPANQWGMVQTANGPVNGKVLATSFLAYNNPPSRPLIANPFDGRNRGPFVMSAGKNRNFYNANGTFENDLDNLYSYRLAGAGRGN